MQKSGLRVSLIVLILVVVLGVMWLWHNREPVKWMPTATWLWNTVAITEESERIKEFLVSQEVKTLYLQIDAAVDRTQYEAFIQEMSSEGIDVHALGGAPWWVYGDGLNDEAGEWLQWIERYQQDASEDARFTGLHLDVEPYLNDDWESNQAMLVEGYQHLLLESQRLASALKLEFGVDIPFWYHEIEYDNRYGSGNLTDWTMRTADVATIMAYRNQAEEDGGLLDILEPLFEIAGENGGRMIIAVETLQQPEFYVSFYGFSREQVDAEMMRVHERFGSNPSLAGYAIHDLNGWRELQNQAVE